MSEHPHRTPVEIGITVLQVVFLFLAGSMVYFNAGWMSGLESGPPEEEGRGLNVIGGIVFFLLIEGGLEFAKRKWGR